MTKYSQLLYLLLNPKHSQTIRPNVAPFEIKNIVVVSLCAAVNAIGHANSRSM